MARFEMAMEDAKTTSLTWEKFNLLLIILGTKHDKFIEDVLKEAKQDPKKLSKELIRESWEALSLMKNEGLDSKGNHNKPKKGINALKKDNKKQEPKKPAPAAAPAQGVTTCPKCKKNHSGECEVRKCEYCYADAADPDRQKVKDTHFSNQCRFQFPEKAPPYWKKPQKTQEQEREGAIRENAPGNNSAMILRALADQVLIGKIEKEFVFI